MKPPSQTDDGFMRGLVAGLTPLVLVAAVVVFCLVAEALVGCLTAGQDFFTQQRIAVIVLIAGLIAAAATYVVTCWQALRHVGDWQRAGFPARARGALLALAGTAVIVLLPILLAIVVPQHPAPQTTIPIH